MTTKHNRYILTRTYALLVYIYTHTQKDAFHISYNLFYLKKQFERKYNHTLKDDI